MTYLETTSACIAWKLCVDFCFVLAIVWDSENNRPAHGYG